LRILSKVDYGDAARREGLLDEVEQLIKIIATIIKNKKSVPSWNKTLLPEGRLELALETWTWT